LYKCAKKEQWLKIKVVTRQPVTLVCRRHQGAYGEAIGEFWRDVVVPWAIQHDLMHLPRYGICYDNPDTTPMEECRYDAGFECTEDLLPPAGSFLSTLPGGTYATLSFKGRVEHMDGAWRALLRTRLPSSRQALGERPGFQYFSPLSVYDPATGAFECELFVPVIVPKNATQMEL